MLSQQQAKVVTLHSQNYEENKNQQGEQTDTNNTINIIDNNNIKRARAMADFERVCQRYRVNLGWAVSPKISDEIFTYFKEMDADLIIEALDRTMRAPRPSWAYASAILRKWLEQGITTIDAIPSQIPATKSYDFDNIPRYQKAGQRQKQSWERDYNGEPQQLDPEFAKTIREVERQLEQGELQ